MATITFSCVLSLDKKEVKALKKLLGGMGDKDFNNFGIVGEDRVRMSAIWSVLPDASEENK